MPVIQLFVFLLAEVLWFPRTVLVLIGATLTGHRLIFAPVNGARCDLAGFWQSHVALAERIFGYQTPEEEEYESD